MDALIGKLTNLGYEFFGILLPGTLAILMWSLLWIAAADVVPWMTWGAVPQLTLSEAMDAIGRAIERSAFMSVLLMIALAYFVGHLLTWVARGGKRHKHVRRRDHLAGTLCFQPPKRELSYDLKLEPAWQWAGKRLLGKKLELSWSLFYPAAKTYLLQKRIPSLVTTYQNKYTLHRSLAVAAALTAWGALFVAIVGLLAQAIAAHRPPDLTGSQRLYLRQGRLSQFGGSRRATSTTGTLWGNYLITETYVSLRAEEAHDED